MSQIPTLLTVDQFADRHPAFSTSSLRWIIFQAQARRRVINGKAEMISGNGFGPAIKRIGTGRRKRVLIDEAKFFSIVEQQNDSLEACHEVT